MDLILVPTDFSDYSVQALEYAIEIAKRAKAEIILHHSYSTPISPATNFDAYQNAVQEEEAMSVRRLEELKARYSEEFYIGSADKLKISATLMRGLAIDDIKSVTEKKHVSMVVMGTKGASGLEEVFLGSITAKAIKELKCPVLAVPDNARFEGLENIVYTTNFDRDDKKAIELVLDFAKFFNASVSCLHVSTDVDNYLDDLRKIDDLEASLKLAPLDGHFKIVVDEAVEKGIDSYLSDHKTDLLVMLTHERNFIQNLFHRSITKSMAFHTKVPLLVLKRKV